MSYAPKPPLGHAPPPAKKSSTTLIVLIVVGVIGLLGLCCVGGGVALLLPAVQAARDAAQRAQSMNELKELGLAYWNYHDQTGKSPASWDDLTNSGLIGSETVQKLQAQNVTVAWNVELSQLSMGTSEFILAYPSGASGPLVTVLMGDGSVQNIPPDELQRRLDAQAATLAHSE
jgi:hypothetical protein